MHIFYILEKLKLYNQYLVIEMAMELSQMRKKYQTFCRFCLRSKIAKRFAQNLLSLNYHTNSCKVRIRIFLSLLSFYLLIRNLKHGRVYILIVTGIYHLLLSTVKSTVENLVPSSKLNAFYGITIYFRNVL